MESSQNKSKYSSEAIHDILERFERINEVIRMHEAQEGPDNITIKSWKKMKKQLTMQFVALLNDPNLVISVKAKVA